MESYEYDESYGPPQTSGLAIASLVCAFLCQPVGFILGIIAMVKISGSGGRQGGMGMAIAGTIISGVMGFMCMPIIAAIAIPGLLRSRIGANESAAIASMKSICTGEEQFKSAVCVDQNVNGVGEYGFLSELGGTANVRGSDQMFSANPFITTVLGSVDANGVATKSGYCFKIYLPGGRGTALEESKGNPPETDIEGAEFQESAFIAYAWPQTAQRSGCRAFFVNAMGEVFSFANSDSGYSGANNPPPWDAALADTNGDGKVDWKDGIDEKRWVPTW